MGGGAVIYTQKIIRPESSFFAFLDSDDALDIAAIQKFFNLYQTSKADIIRGKGIFMDEEGCLTHYIPSSITPNQPIKTTDFLASLQTSYFVFNATNCLIKSHIFADGLRYREGVINEDMEFGFELLLRAKSIAHTNTITYYHTIRHYSISHPSSFLNIHSEKTFYQTYYSQLNYLKALQSLYKNAAFEHLINKTLRSSASSGIINLLYKNPKDKKQVKVFLPYASIKAKLCYLFPRIYSFLRYFYYKTRY